MGRKKGKERPNRVELRLSDVEFEQVESVARESGVTVAELIRSALFPRDDERIATIVVGVAEPVERIERVQSATIPDEPPREYPPCQNCKNYRLATCGRNCPNRR